MKTILFSLIAVFLLASFMPAQVTRETIAGDQEMISVTNETYITTTTDKGSQWFSLTGQDAFSWYTYPWRINITATVPTTGNRKIVLYLQGSMDKTNTANLDTLKSTDSLLTTTPYNTTTDFNNFKYPYYRWYYDAQTGNSDSVYCTVKMWNPMLNRFITP